MIKNLFTLTFLIFSFSLSAQKTYNSTSMVVSHADLENSTYEKDTTANALFLYEKGFSRVENGGDYNLLTDYEAKVKILNKQGVDQATIQVHLYRNKSRKELFRNLVAYTYNLENGKVTKTQIKKQNIYYEKYDENHTLVKFTFPNVKPGSVLTYTYQLESPFIYKFNGWEFQAGIPKIYSKFIADLPGNYVYNIKLVGTLKLETDESTIIKQCLEVPRGGHADCSHNVYGMRDIPAFKKEEYMTAKKNYFSRIDFELKEYKGFDGINKKYTETWKNVDKEFKKEPSVGLQLKKINATKNILPDSIQTMPTSLLKAKMIYKFVTDNYKWNGKYELFKGNNKDSEIKNVIENKTGNISGINVLMHNILKQQGFNVNPILLSTRKNGYATKLYPVISDFNYLIVQLSIDEETFLLDASENMLAFGEVPFRCLNQYGRLLNFDKGSSWIDIKSRQRSSCFYKEDLALTPELKLNGEARHIFSGYHGYFKRKNLNQVNIDDYLEKLKKLNPEINITNASIKNLRKLEKAYKEEFNFVRNTEQIDDLIFIKPFLKPFFEENPFKLNERTYPVDFGYKDSYTYLVSIELPEGFEFIDIPKRQGHIIPNSLGKISIDFQQNNNKLIISHRISFDSPYYPTEYYSVLKEFFNLIVQIENDTLITVKKIN